MFGLPLFTTVTIVSIPLVWILYTIGFWLASRHWTALGEED